MSYKPMSRLQLAVVAVATLSPSITSSSAAVAASGVDPNALFEWAGWEYRTTSLEPWHVSGLMALLCADVMEPVRIMLTVAATPRVAKALRKRRDSPPSDDGESKSQ